ncbi:MAG: phenylacetate--CoA ligase family protein [Lachnospiraceae bacterium]|nr:phenylacetate--CoA ligase family protein [Lachnospiraceae bacterium]
MNYIKTLMELSRLKKNAKLSASQMKKLQNKKLRNLLHYAWQHSDYYRKAFEEAGIQENQLDTLPLSAFPTMDKKTLLWHFDEIITVSGLTQDALYEFDTNARTDREAYLDQYHVVHSSGSTGKPGYFIYDNKAWNGMLLGIIRGALWGLSIFQIIRLLLSRPRVLYIAATDGSYGGAMAVGDGIDGVGAKQMYLDINTPLVQWVETVCEFQPDIIIGYPSAIKILAELIAKGEVKADIKRIVSCGEPLSLGLRKYLTDIFHVPIINFYGASESLALGIETGQENGMLLFDDLNVIEVEDGAMYLTCLYNYAQPLIRYHITDHLVLREKTEDTPFTQAEILLGRDEDLLWFENEEGHRDFLHPLSVEGFCIEGLRDYQFLQLSSNRFEMLAQAKEEAHHFIQQEMHLQMGKILADKGLDYVHFSVHFVNHILPDPNTGKKPLIITSEGYKRMGAKLEENQLAGDGLTKDKPTGREAVAV